VQPTLDGAARWRLVSQLTLNQLSIVEGTQALQRLRDMLSLNNLTQDLSAQQQIQGIVSLACHRVTRHVAGDAWQGYRQGYRVVLQLDSELFRDCSRMLFGAVLHRFLALYAGINTFVELAVHDEMDRPLHTWRPLPQRGRLGL
jgi:type VI secretion system protein ImpG